MIDQDILLLEKYYRFKLSEEELQAFEEKVKTDESFAEKVMEYHRSQNDAAKFFQSAEESERDANWEKLWSEDETGDVMPSQSRNRWVRWAAAAMIIISGTWGLIYWQGNAQLSLEEVLVEAKAIDAMPEYKTLRADPQQQLISDAYAFFQEANYAAAIILLEKVSPDETHYVDALMLNAISHYQLEQYEAAQEKLELVGAVVDDEMKITVWWYQSLISIHLGNQAVARKMLSMIAESDHHLSKSAVHILDLLSQVQPEP